MNTRAWRMNQEIRLEMKKPVIERETGWGEGGGSQHMSLAQATHLHTPTHTPTHHQRHRREEKSKRTWDTDLKLRQTRVDGFGGKRLMVISWTQVRWRSNQWTHTIDDRSLCEMGIGQSVVWGTGKSRGGRETAKAYCMATRLQLHTTHSVTRKNTTVFTRSYGLSTP